MELVELFNVYRGKCQKKSTCFLYTLTTTKRLHNMQLSTLAFDILYTLIYINTQQP